MYWKYRKPGNCYRKTPRSSRIVESSEINPARTTPTSASGGRSSVGLESRPPRRELSHEDYQPRLLSDSRIATIGLRKAEPCGGKLASTVLRGAGGRKAPRPTRRRRESILL